LLSVLTSGSDCLDLRSRKSLTTCQVRRKLYSLTHLFILVDVVWTACVVESAGFSPVRRCRVSESRLSGRVAGTVSRWIQRTVVSSGGNGDWRWQWQLDWSYEVLSSGF